MYVDARLLTGEEVRFLNAAWVLLYCYRMAVYEKCRLDCSSAWLLYVPLSQQNNITLGIFLILASKLQT